MLNHQLQDFFSFHVFKMIFLPLHQIFELFRKTPLVCELKSQQIFSDSKIPFIYFKYKQQQILNETYIPIATHSQWKKFDVTHSLHHSNTYGSVKWRARRLYMVFNMCRMESIAIHFSLS